MKRKKFRFFLDRRRESGAAARERGLLRALVEHASGPAMLIDRGAKQVLEHNLDARRLIDSYSADGLARFLEEILEHVDRVGPDGSGKRVTVQVMQPGGLSIRMELSFHLLEDLAPGQLIAFLHQTDQSVRLSMRILQESAQLVVVWSRAAEVLYANAAVVKTLGYPAPDLVGNGWWEMPIRDEAQAQQEKQHIRDVFAGNLALPGNPYLFEYRTKEGKSCWIQWKDALSQDDLLISIGTDHTDERRNTLLRSVIFNIAEASSKVKSPGEFYHFIHEEIRRVIDTPNFYIAVYDQVLDIVHFPYYADAADRKPPFSRKAGKGLTELTIKRKRPLLASKEEIRQLDAEGLVEIMGQSIPEVWLGVPLLHNDEVVGLITIQDYARADAYTSDDLSLLTFIAGQVAHFVSKLQQDEALRINEERFRAIYDHSAVGIAQISFEGKFIQVNQRFCEIFGYNQDELANLGPLDLTYPEDLEIGMKDLEEVKSGERPTYTVEKRYVHKDGNIVFIRVNVSSYRQDENSQFVISVYEDITERIQAEEETAMLFSLSNALNIAETKEQAVTDTLLHVFEHGSWDYGEAWMLDERARLLQIRTRNSIHGLDLPSLTNGAGIDSGEDIYWLEAQDLEGVEYVRGREFHACGFSTVALMPLFVNDRVMAVVLVAAQRRWDANERSLRALSAARAQLRTFILRKVAERAQRESEARYKAITEAAFEGIVIHRHGRILQANQAFANLVGMRPSDLEGRHVLEIAGDESSRITLMKVVEDEGTVSFKGRSYSGGWRDLEAVGRTGVWEGQPAGIIAMRDVTHERLIEAAREEARLDARFRAYVQNSTEMILILDENLRIQYASPTLERFTELPPDAVVGTPWLDLLHPEEAASAQQVLSFVAEHAGLSDKAGLQIMTKGGEWRSFQVAFTNLLHDPMVKGIFVSAHDITDLKRTEAALLENEAKFRAIFSQANDAILVLEDNFIVECNEKAVDMFGAARTRLMGATLANYSPEFQSGERRSSIAIEEHLRTALGGHDQHFNWKHQRADGEIFDAEVRMSQMHLGDRLFIQCVVRDITERIRAENELIRRNFELDSFVYRASHDLKAPLNSLMGLQEVMAMEIKDPEVQKYLKMMNKSVVKLDNFIHDLADFSRNDRTEVACLPVDWEQLVQETFDNLKFMDTADRVRQIVEVKQSGEFFTDPVRAGMVVNNLISNAIKYQNLSRPDPFVRVEILSDAQKATIVISDNGIGIAEEHVGKVFNLFFRASFQSYGSGMGMYIVKSAVERLQGTVQLESRINEGTRFTVILPNLKA